MSVLNAKAPRGKGAEKKSNPLRPFILRAVALNLVFLLAALALTGLACTLPGRAPPAGAPVGTLTRQLDLVEQGLAGRALQAVTGTSLLHAGDALRVSQGGEGLLDFGQQLQLRLFNDTSTNLVEAASAPGAPLFVRLYLELGGFTGRLQSPGSFQVRTPSGAQILVLGTRFFVIYDPATGITWVGNFDGLLGVAAGGALTPLPAGTYLMVPAGERPGPPLPLTFTPEQFESRARQLASPSAALARLALAGRPDLPHANRPPALLTPLASQPPSAAAPPASLPPETGAPPTEQARVEAQPPARPPPSLPPGVLPTPDRQPPLIALLPPSSEPVGVGLTCPPGGGVVRLKADVRDPSGVSAVTAFWSLDSLRGAVALRRNAKGNYIGEIGPLAVEGRLAVTLSAMDGAGNLGSNPPFEIELYACPDLSTPVIGALEITTDISAEQLCAGTPAPLQVSAQVRDDGRLQEVFAVWESGGLRPTQAMQDQGDGRYRTSLLLDVPPGPLAVHVEARDAGGNQAASDPKLFQMRDCTPDLAPQIRSFELSAQQIAAGVDCPGLPSTVRLIAGVVDDRGVASVSAGWKLGDLSGEQQLVYLGQDRYQAELGPFDLQGTLMIELNAVDSAGQPAKARSAAVEVTDCPDAQGPVIKDVSVEPATIAVQPGCPGADVATVTATISDQGGVNRASAAWQLGDLRDEALMVEADQGVYRASLGPFQQAGYLYITVYAWDEAGNQSLAKAGPAEVVACQARP
jgi:hypothetical protein